MTSINAAMRMELKSSRSFAGSRVLVVDDNSENIKVIGNILRTEGYSVGFASNGSKALEVISNSSGFDAILLDIDMPEKNGYETCLELRKMEGFKDIPVIFLTAFTETDNVVRGFEVGAQDYITKPFKSKELLARVSTHIELKKNRERLKEVSQWLEEQVQQRTSDLLHTNRKLKQAMKELQLMDEVKSEFLSILGHEIRTPLNGIMVPIELMKREEMPDGMQSVFSILSRSVEELEKFSMLALEISKLRATGLEAGNLGEIDLVEMTKSCLGAIEKKDPVADAWLLEFDHPQMWVLGSPNYLNRALSIVIGNAMKHSPADEKIRIYIRGSKDYVRIYVHDKGPGFPENMLGGSVKPFLTGGRHINKNCGLELYFASVSVENHGGMIEIGNNPEGGAYVIINLPHGLTTMAPTEKTENEFKLQGDFDSA
jgi:two-component system sensor histidine kinase/response regulator